MEGLDLKMLDEDMLLEEEDQEVSLDAIRQKALEGIKITYLEDVKAQPLPKKNKKWQRTLIPLVAAIGILGATAIGIGSNEHLRNLFGESFGLIAPQVQSIQVEDRSNGIIFKVEEAAIDSHQGLVIISAEREDGGIFEEGQTFLALRPDLDTRGGMGWYQDNYLSEDATKLYAFVNLSTERKLYKHTLSFTGKHIGKWYRGDVLTETTLQETMGDTAVHVKADEGLPDVACIATLEDTGRLAVTLSYEAIGDDTLFDTWAYLEDSRTGEIIESTNGTSDWNGEEGVASHTSYFSGIAASDVPYLTLGLADYEVFDITHQGTWQVAFKLDKNNHALTLRP